MLNQDMRSYFLSLNDSGRNELIEYIMKSNVTKTDPYIESISLKGVMVVRFIDRVPFMNISLLNSTHI